MSDKINLMNNYTKIIYHIKLVGADLAGNVIKPESTLS